MFASITSSKADDYTAIVENNKIYVYCNDDLICEYSADKNFNAAVYDDGCLYYTKDDSNIIYILNLQTDSKKEISLKKFKEVRILKTVNRPNCFVLETDNNSVMVYDIVSDKCILKFSANESFFDLYFDSPDSGPYML